ncbi:extracellular sialidase/neuraminidase [Metarhizium acridum CQMa 102]|uniref:Extracellular sialidase/neuraminidase n=1 Tax=Metarhizium acridum (strain CQMa 102) TaxID=655827 RepID=E9DRA2_METAQ|nr:extracellular sialidase/neuraminidase [Metarhizium acridum CQMa 102]EFY93780.1 extracellular sialidase/neuraminidase [Metarhizium acridum CQMa 102]
MKASVLFVWLTTTLGGSLAAAVVKDIAKDVPPAHKEFVLFKSSNMAGADKLANGVGFHSFRVPAVVTTSTGRVLAFAEGRRHDNRDLGDVKVVMKRTKTVNSHGSNPSDWESLQVVTKDDGVWGNPTPVVDGPTIYLFLSWNNAKYSRDGEDRLPNGKKTKKVDGSWKSRRHTYLTQSTDDGQTWSEPREMTRQLTPGGRGWDVVGPGNGIVLTSGEVVVPAMGRNIVGKGTPGQRTWSYKRLKGAGAEGTIVQTPDGKLYRNDRAGKDEEYRKIARGTLAKFGSFTLDKGLPDPDCAGATLLFNRADDKGPARVVFLNSADKNTRRAMRVRISYDKNAKEYSHGRKLSDAPVSGAGNEGGYASLTKTADSEIGALVETDFDQTGGSKDDYHAIIWRKFNLSWVLHGPKK